MMGKDLVGRPTVTTEVPPSSERAPVRPQRLARPKLISMRGSAVLLLLMLSSGTRGEDSVPCNLCGDAGGVVGRPDTVVQEPVEGTNVTCGELEDQAASGTFNALQCTILQFSMSTPCGCTTPPPGGVPTSTPVATATRAPTRFPAVATPSPTGTAVAPPPVFDNVTSQVRIVFTGASGRMNDNLTAWFEDETCSFWESELPPEEANGLSCLVRDQILTTSATPRVLDVRMQVVARQTSLGTGPELADQLAFTLTNNSDAYLAALNRPFFDAVTSVEATALNATNAPTASPIAAATSGPTAATTRAPAAAGTGAPAAPVPTPTPAPTLRPTQPLIDLTGRVELLMEYLVGEMTGAIEATFVNVTTDFLAQYLGTGSAPLVDIATAVLAQVAGPTEGEVDRPITAILSVTGKRKVPFELGDEVANTLNTYSTEYIQALQNASSAPAQIYFKSVQNVSATAADTPPTSAPASSPAPTASPPSTSSGSSLSGGAIAGIVIGCLVFVAVAAYLVYHLNSDKAKPPTGSRHAAVVLGSSDAPPPSTSYDSPASKGSASQRPSALKKPAPAAKSEEAPVLSTSAAAAALVASAARKRDEDDFSASTRAEEAAVAGTALAPPSGEGNDDGSFTYSLNDGFEQSQATPRRSGPGVGASPAVSSASGGEGDSSMGGMSGVTSGATSGATASTASEDRITRKFKRTVIAPEGKLGIIIDTTVEGPIVYKVNVNSPLEGVIFPGDLIIKIDDIETRAMSANNITTLMVQTAGQKRALTVLSDDPSR